MRGRILPTNEVTAEEQTTNKTPTQKVSVTPTASGKLAYQPSQQANKQQNNHNNRGATGTHSQHQLQKQNKSQTQTGTQGQQAKSATLANTQGNRFNITLTITAYLTVFAGILTGSLAYVLKRKRD